MPTSRRYRSNRRGAKPVLRWMSTASASSAVAAGVQGFFDMTDVDLIPTGWDSGFTIIRAIGKILIRPSTGSVDYFGAFGLGVVSRDAVAAGALPEPNGDLYQWYLQTAFLRRSVAVEFVEFPFDLRSSRKIPSENHTLAAVIDNAGGSGSTLNWAIEARLLLRRS